MDRLFEYADKDIFCHHSIDISPEGADFYVHAHERMELLLFISGEANFFVEGSEYPMEPYDVLIMRSAEVHRTQIISHAPYERIAIHFSSSLIHSVDEEGILLRPYLERPLGRLNHYSGKDIRSRWLHEAIKALDCDASAPRARLRVITALLGLLSEISELFESREKPSLPRQDEGIAAHLVEYINANLFTEISLKSISRRFYISPSQLNRIFGRATGSSVWEYIRIKRLLAARERIVAGERAATVCTLCGFKDYSAFYRAYKARFGHAPSEESGRQEK